MRRKFVAVGVLIALVALGVAIYFDKNGRAIESNAGTMGQTESAAVTPDKQSSTTLLGGELPDRSMVIESSPAPLFSDAPDSELDHHALEDFIRARPISAYRIVRVDSDALRTRIRESATTQSFEVQLLESAPFTLVAKGAKEYASEWQSGHGSWIGVVDGDEFSRASFVVGADGSVNGVIRTLKSGRIKIEPIKGTPHHIIWQWDPNYERAID